MKSWIVLALVVLWATGALWFATNSVAQRLDSVCTTEETYLGAFRCYAVPPPPPTATPTKFTPRPAWDYPGYWIAATDRAVQGTATPTVTITPASFMRGR